MTYSELRASDAERERVVAFLREHALLGRLTDDELEERIGLAYAAVTVGDLETLIADLPRASRPRSRPAVARPSAPRPSAVRHHHHRHGPPPALIGLGIGALLISGVGVAALGLIVAIGVALIATVFALSVVLGPILLVALLIIAASKRHHRRGAGALAHRSTERQRATNGEDGSRSSPPLPITQDQTARRGGLSRSRRRVSTHVRDDLTALRELERVPLGLPAGLELEWLGVAGYRLTYEGTTVLVDPYVSRVPLLSVSCAGPTLPDATLIDRYVRRADAILIGHTHWDHAVDAPAIARRDGATVYGSDSLARLMALHGLDGVIVEPGAGTRSARSRSASRPAATRSCCSAARSRSTAR